jgi:hypothetical protein
MMEERHMFQDLELNPGGRDAESALEANKKKE